MFERPKDAFIPVVPSTDHGCRPRCFRSHRAESFRRQAIGGSSRPSGLEVEHDFEFGGPYDRQLRGLLALENAPGIHSDLAIGNRWRVWDAVAEPSSTLKIPAAACSLAIRQPPLRSTAYSRARSGAGAYGGPRGGHGNARAGGSASGKGSSSASKLTTLDGGKDRSRRKKEKTVVPPFKN